MKRRPPATILYGGPAPTSVPEPAPSKPTVRAQIVPIASRREITISQTTEAFPELKSRRWRKAAGTSQRKGAFLHGGPDGQDLATQRTPVPDRAALPPLPTQRTVMERTAVSPAPKLAAAEKTAVTERTRVTEKPVVAEKPAAEKTTITEKPTVTEKRAVPEKMALPVPKPAEEPAAQAKSKVDETDDEDSHFSITAPAGRGKLMWVAGGAAVALLLLSGMLVYPGLGHKSRQSVSATGADSSALALHVERSAGALLLTWNRDSEAVKNAAHAELAINDGDQHENVNVDMAQLRNGSIVYTPSGADIVFQLSVTGKDSSKVESESVRVLHTRPSPMPDNPSALTEKTTTTDGSAGSRHERAGSSEPHGGNRGEHR